MAGNMPVSEDILENEPIVFATTTYDTGITVTGGVYKSSDPTSYNVKFLYVFDADGNRMPFVLDPSDDEDFRESGRRFYLNREEQGNEYILYIEEKGAVK